MIAFLGQSSAALGEELGTKDLNEDQSLFKAQGTVWHQVHRQFGQVPEKLRNLDKEVSWKKSAYHGWVYGYGLHLTNNQAGLSILIEVEMASFCEQKALERKQDFILKQLKSQSLCGDNAYTQATRIGRWAKAGVLWLTPALRWRKGRYAHTYRAFIKGKARQRILKKRKTAIEPIFELRSQILGTKGKQKQLFRQGLRNVRAHLGLAVLSLQLAMIANHVWNLPFRSISDIRGTLA